MSPPPQPGPSPSCKETGDDAIISRAYLIAGTSSVRTFPGQVSPCSGPDTVDRCCLVPGLPSRSFLALHRSPVSWHVQERFEGKSPLMAYQPGDRHPPPSPCVKVDLASAAGWRPPKSGVGVTGDLKRWRKAAPNFRRDGNICATGRAEDGFNSRSLHQCVDGASISGQVSHTDRGLVSNVALCPRLQGGSPPFLSFVLRGS